MKTSSWFSNRFVAVLAVMVCLPALTFGQGTTGTITGTVTDSTGAVIPGAKITVIDADSGAAFTAETGVNGVYQIPQLAASTYNIAAETEGFKRGEVNGLRLNVNTTAEANFTLEIGAVTEVVEVSAAQVQIETTNSTVGSTVQVEQVLELPIAGRDVFNLVNLVPGAFRSESNGNVSIGGSRSRSTAAMVDGINNTRGGLGVQNIELAPPVDSMQEFKVQVNNMGADYGRSAAGFINAVTRSGTNEWNFSAYEFLRNDKVDAAGWNNDTKPKLRQNNFGGTIGGPIVKNKTFVFYNADLFRRRFGNVRTRSVGLPEWRSGDFSTATQRSGGNAVLVPIHDPLTRTRGSLRDPRGTEQFPNNIIPSDRLDPAAVRAVSFIPDPNRTPNNPFNNAGNWQENTSNIRNRDYHTARVDHTFSDKWRTYLRMILTEPDDTITGYSQGYGVADQNGLDIFNRRQNWGLNNTYTFSPNFFMQALIGFNRVFVRRESGDCCDTNYADFFGIPGFEKGGEVFPRFNIQGGRVPVNQIGAAGNANRTAVFTNFDFEPNFTLIKGNHTMKFGGKYTAYQGNEVSRPQPTGAWRFQGNMTRFRAEGGRRDVNTGVNLADFMLGLPWNIDARVAPGIGKRIKYFAGYFQDDWRVNSRLTINLGVRYETETPITEVGGRMNGFCEFCPNPRAGLNGIPENAIGRVLFPNRDGTGKYLWQWDKNNIAPRFGFAYRLKEDGSMVIRGGFGIFFGNPYDRNSIQPGRAGFDNIFRRRGGAGTFLSRDGIPPGALDDIPEEELNGGFGTVGTRFATSTIQFWNEDRVLPYAQNFNLTLQNTWKGVLFEFGILGNLARHQAINNLNINHIRPENLPLTEGLNARQIEEQFRPWTAWDGRQDQIQLFSPNWGVSNYYGFTFKSERRFSNGLGWTIAYTHTQWIDNIRFIGGADTFGDNDNPQDIYNLRAERSSSVNRLPHRLVLAPIWDLPFGRGKKWGGNWAKPVDWVLGGWQVSTIGTLRSGGYFGAGVANGGDIRGDNAPGIALRPNLTGQEFKHPRIGDPAPDGIVGLYWLNPDAFEIPENFTLGNASRTLPGIRGPRAIDFNFMLAKNVRWGEKYRAQFRWEMFNFMNTPRFSLPADSIGGGNFTYVTGTFGNTNNAPPRRIMQFGMKLYF